MTLQLYKFFTSYYGRKGLPIRRCIGITPVVPKGYTGAVDRRLAPSSAQLRELRGARSDAELKAWREGYFAWIGRKITPKDAAELIEGKILLSHESPSYPSHRTMIADWLAFHGIAAISKEWGGETEDEVGQREMPLEPPKAALESQAGEALK